MWNFCVVISAPRTQDEASSWRWLSLLPAYTITVAVVQKLPEAPLHEPLRWRRFPCWIARCYWWTAAAKSRGSDGWGNAAIIQYCTYRTAYGPLWFRESLRLCQHSSRGNSHGSGMLTVGTVFFGLIQGFIRPSLGHPLGYKTVLCRAVQHISTTLNNVETPNGLESKW